MDIIDRYVYAVTKGLPQKQKEDIEKELRSMIDDMMEKHQGPEADEIKAQKVLQKLGDPVLLANNYRDTKRYLISLQNFDMYLLLLKLVFGAVFLGVSISALFSPEQSAVKVISWYLGALISGLLQGFAWVTIIFVIADYYNVKPLDVKEEKDSWDISKLPEIPEKKAIIPRSESIAAIVFSTIFIIIFWYAPQVFAAYISNNQGGLAVIPLFNINILNGYRGYIAVIFIIGIIKELSKLLYGRWSLKLSISITALCILSLVFTLIILSNQAIWNGSFAAEIMHYTNLSFNLAKVWLIVTGQVMTIFIIFSVLEILTVLYKGIKYN